MLQVSNTHDTVSQALQVIDKEGCPTFPFRPEMHRKNMNSVSQT